VIPVLDLGPGHAEVADELAEAFAAVRDGGTFVLGAEVTAFESEFAQYCGVGHCVGVGNGFDAIQLLLRADGIGVGDEVLVPAYTAVATWMAVAATGATPVGVDVEPETWTMDVAAARARFSSRTRALLPVHLFGHPADLEPLAVLARERDLALYEDAAQAHGATYRGRRVGGLARAATFSFYPTKNLGALGDGGAIVTDDNELADRLRLLRAYGWRQRSESEIKGFNSRLDELQAALLRIKLRRLDAWNERRRSVAAAYLSGLVDTALTLPPERDWAEPVWHLFVVATERAEDVRRKLAAAGIQTLVHYRPLPHLTSAFRADGWRDGDLPIAEALAGRAISLPMYPQLTREQCEHVVTAVREAL
jgi:dTDP-3-amino-3,4,6-trideoxy-alpha-D-glucose transaminase